jgi:DnaJ-class molecular chaperone
MKPTSNSTHVTKNKKGDVRYEIPYEASVDYAHPRSDQVTPACQVDVPEELLNSTVEIETIEEGIELYLDAHRLKFVGQLGVT